MKLITNIIKVEVIKVIQIEEVVGDGSKDDPIKKIIHHYNLEGKYLFTKDPSRELL